MPVPTPVPTTTCDRYQGGWQHSVARLHENRDGWPPVRYQTCVNLTRTETRQHCGVRNEIFLEMTQRLLPPLVCPSHQSNRRIVRTFQACQWA